jgi:hypothetical protein
MSAVPSLDASSTTTTLVGAQVWPATPASACSMKAAALWAGMTTPTVGRGREVWARRLDISKAIGVTDDPAGRRPTERVRAQGRVGAGALGAVGAQPPSSLGPPEGRSPRT